MAQRNARPCPIIGVLRVALASIYGDEPRGVGVVEHKFFRCLDNLLRRSLAGNSDGQAAKDGIDVDLTEVQASHLLPELGLVDGLVPCYAALHRCLIRFERSYASDRIRPHS